MRDSPACRAIGTAMASQIEEYALEKALHAAHNGAGLNGGADLKHLTWLLSASVLLVSWTFAASTPSPSNGRKVYSWVDEQGITHYGDQIPPEYAAQEHRVFNGQGIEVEHTEAQKTPDQLAEEDSRKADAA